MSGLSAFPGTLCCPSCDESVTHARSEAPDVDTACPACDHPVPVKRDGMRLLSWGISRTWDLLTCQKCGFLMKIDLRPVHWGPIEIACPKCGWNEVANFIQNPLQVTKKGRIPWRGALKTAKVVMKGAQVGNYIGHAIDIVTEF